MHYADVRNQIRTGDVLAFMGGGFWSRAIQFRTLSRVSHVGLAYWIGGRLAVFEAKEGQGVRLYPLSVYLKTTGYKIDWYKLLASRYDIHRPAIGEFCQEHWGRCYASAWQFLRSWGLVSRRIANQLGIPEDTDTEKFFCSEFVLSALRQAGYRGEGYLNPANTSPGDVVLLPCLHREGEIQW